MLEGRWKYPGPSKCQPDFPGRQSPISAGNLVAGSLFRGIELRVVLAVDMPMLAGPSGKTSPSKSRKGGDSVNVRQAVRGPRCSALCIGGKIGLLQRHPPPHSL